MTALGERIRQLRQRKGLTQEGVAWRAGMSAKGFGELERGVATDPHYSTLCAIARGLEVPLFQLLWDVDEPTGDAATPLRERGQ